MNFLIRTTFRFWRPLLNRWVMSLYPHIIGKSVLRGIQRHIDKQYFLDLKKRGK